MNAGPTKILVVDDSALYRQSVCNVLREVTDAEIVGIAKNGIEALEKIEALDPDLLTLDVQMPDMDGIQVLNEIKRRRLRPKAIMVSSFTSEGAQVTTDALMEGAFDFILKPSSSDSVANRQHLRDALQEKISAFREANLQSSVPDARSVRDARARQIRRARRPTRERRVAADDVVEPAPAPAAACRAVIIGTSTGGPEALKIVLPRLPADLPVPVFVVQHMPPQYTRSLALRLHEICQPDVVEATDMTAAVAGGIFIAPGGQHMALERDRSRVRIRLNRDPPENGVRPSVDHLIRSACDLFDGNLLAVIMTGMGRDGLEGCEKLKRAGGHVFAQCQDDCVVYGMPKAVIERELADRILPLGKIAPAIVRHLKRSRRT